LKIVQKQHQLIYLYKSYSFRYFTKRSIKFQVFFSKSLRHIIKISNRRATQWCNVSSFFYAKICSLLARRRSSQPVQRVYWPENVIDWLGKWRPTCVMRHARGQKLQSFRRKWPFYMDLYSMIERRIFCMLSRNTRSKLMET
jgi:hypothetical protein